MYQPLSGFQPSLWSDTSQGVVAGVVTEVAGNSFTVQALDGTVMDISTTSMTHVPMMLEIKEGVPIRVTGTTTTKDAVETFEAHEVRPFHGRRGAAHRPGEGRGRVGDGASTGRGMHLVAPGGDTR